MATKHRHHARCFSVCVCLCVYVFWGHPICHEHNFQTATSCALVWCMCVCFGVCVCVLGPSHMPRTHVPNIDIMRCRRLRARHCNTLQHTATHCNTLQHTATHCNTLQQTQHTATHCNILQHVAVSQRHTRLENTRTWGQARVYPIDRETEKATDRESACLQESENSFQEFLLCIFTFQNNSPKKKLWRKAWDLKLI